MIAAEILRNEISHLKILSVNFKNPTAEPEINVYPLQLAACRINRMCALNLAARPQFGYARILNFIGRRKTWPAKQMCRRADPAATPNPAVNFIVSQRDKFRAAEQILRATD